MKTFSPKTIDQWRQWLADHNDSESEVWLVFHKVHTGVASIDYKDALDEALCFGWVDSLVKRLDEQRYARKFTPRRADSRWSNVNRTRYAALKASGRLKPAGINRAPTDRSYDAFAPRLNSGVRWTQMEAAPSSAASRRTRRRTKRWQTLIPT